MNRIPIVMVSRVRAEQGLDAGRTFDLVCELAQADKTLLHLACLPRWLAVASVGLALPRASLRNGLRRPLICNSCRCNS